MTKQKESLLTQVSLWLSILGGMSYVTYIGFRGEASASAIISLEKKQEAIENIRIDIAVIREELKQIRNILKSE